MIRVQASVLVEAPPEAVWEFVNDAARWPEWVALTDRVTDVSEGPFGEGMVYREEAGPGPFVVKSVWRIAEFDPPRRQVHVGDYGVMRPALTIELDPSGGYTRVYQTVDAEVLPGARPVGWLLERLFVRALVRRGIHATLRNLKRAVEAEHREDDPGEE